ncbi:DUF6157 family protein [Brevibacterium samyangense]
MGTTNYTNTFIAVAEDCPVASAEVPPVPVKGPTVFARGQPCLRSSPLAKRYGWGFHYDAEGRVALVPVGSPEYEAFVTDDSLTVVKAMRSKRK